MSASVDIRRPPTAYSPRGRILSLTDGENGAAPYFLYAPRSAGPNAALLVTVHGLARNAISHITRFRDLAEKAGVICLAPFFSKRDHRRFQRLAPGRDGRRPDQALQAAIDDAGRRLQCSFKQARMFGYSGGGQFVHRYAMRYPERVKRAVLAAPGWFTFPDPTAPFPYGLAASDGCPKIDFDGFLRIPITVIVGENDTERDQALNKSPIIDRMQGFDRLERARNWIAAMSAACAERGRPPNIDLAVLSRAGHCFEHNMDRRGLGDFVFRALFPAQEGADEGSLSSAVPIRNTA